MLPARWGISLGAIAVVMFLAACDHEEPGPGVVTPGFELSTTIEGLSLPSGVEFASDGRVFVIEKRGMVLGFDSIDDPSSTVVADLRDSIHNYEDRGLLGLAIDPEFPTRPYLYVFYTLDRDNSWNDTCPNPPGTFNDGCVVDGRLSKLTVDEDNQLVGDEEVLLEDMWCSQFPSHTVGDLEFMDDGSLLVSAGDGADYNSVDYGQHGGSSGSPTPANPCGDPPFAVGDPHTLPTAQGGALRSQALLTAEETHTYDGAILRVDPDTGEAHPTNPLVGGSDTVAERIVAHGLRNPYRMTTRPGTDEVWLGDVGWGGSEEINRIVDVEDDVVENFGWPCYEGSEMQGSYASLDSDLCTGLYNGTTPTALTDPYFAYRHGAPPDPEVCGGGEGASLTAISFYDGGEGAFPPAYDGSLFFGDYARGCVWTMPLDASGDPDPSLIETIVDDVFPVDLEQGPDGDMFLVDIVRGRVERISFVGDEIRPTADIEVSSDNGPVPLEVTFDGTGSTANIEGELTYEWDLDGDDAFDDGTAPTASHTYTEAGPVTARLRVTNENDLTDTASITIYPGNTRPEPVIEAPAAETEWAVDDEVALVGSATDAEDGELGPEAFEWQVNLHHCYSSSDCHVHFLEAFTGQDTGTFVAPNHEYPSYIELVLTVTDSDGVTGETSLRLDPQTIDIVVTSDPTGLLLGLGSKAFATPSTQTVVAGSALTLIAPDRQPVDGGFVEFDSWSDGGARIHQVTVTEPGTYTANYVPSAGTDPDVVYVSDLPWVSEVNGFGPAERDMSNGDDAPADGGPLSLRGEVFDKGIGAHAAGEIVVDVPPDCSALQAVVGVDDEVGANGTVTFSVLGDGAELASTPVLEGGTSDPHTLFADVVGVEQITLVVGNGGDDNFWDHADWGEARFTGCAEPNEPPDPDVVYLSDLPWVSEVNGFGPAERDMSNGDDAPADGGPLSLRGEVFDKGIGAHAAGEIVVDVPPDCSALQAVVGVDDEVGANGTVTFSVLGDGAELASTPVLEGDTSPAHPLTVDVADVEQITLVVGDGGDDNFWDHADWGDARFLCGDPGEPPDPPGGFDPPVSLPAGDRPHSVVPHDLNGDGLPDLVAALAGGEAAAVFLNTGSGFAEAVTYPTGPGTFPKHVEVGDITGDGVPDLVTANQDSASGVDVTVFPGAGDGTFGTGVSYVACSRPHQTALGDVDDDGSLDVMVACWGGGVVSVLLNDGSGNLGPAVDYPAADAPHSLVLEDFDGDGVLDAAVAAFGDNQVAVLQGNGDGTFGAPTLYWAGLGTHNVLSGDLNADGDVDLVATAELDGAVGVLLGNGDGTFADAVFYDVGPSPKATAIGDLDGDGFDDLVTANTHGNYPDGSTPTTLTVWLGNGDGTFEEGFTLANDLTPFSVTVGDLYDEGTDAIASANWHSGDVKVHRRPPSP